MFTRSLRSRDLLALVLIPAAFCAGCTTIRGTVPANCFPDSSQSPRGNRQAIDYSLLRQAPPDVYLLGPRDVLGVFIEAVLGKVNEPPPVYFPPYQVAGQERPPAMGFPMPVREDGTISLPLIPEPIEVAGLTLAQVEEVIYNKYNVEHHIQTAGHNRNIVTLIEPRKYNVIVVREDGVDKEGRPLQSAKYQYTPLGSMLEPPKMGIAQSIELEGL